MIELIKEKKYNLINHKLYSSYLKSKTRYVGYLDCYYVPKIKLNQIPEFVVKIIRENKIKKCVHDLVKLIINFLKINNENKNPFGIFVSIFNGKELRGCIGYFNNGITTAKENLVKSTIQSYCCDSRFLHKPIKPDENLNYKISLLHPSENIEVSNLETFYKNNLGYYGLTLYFEDGKSETFLGSVVKDIYNETKNFKDILLKLSVKSGCKKCKIIKADKYKCETI